MEKSAEVLIGMAALGLTAAAAFVVYRWRQRKRLRWVEKWVKDYLCVRYGELPNPLSINCSDDPLWPVLVAFDTPRTGSRHSMQFTCGGRHSTCELLSEKEEEREKRPLRESATVNPPRAAALG
jgi:hypothetical protein